MKRANSLWAAALPVPHVSILTAHIVLRFGDVTYWHYVSHSINHKVTSIRHGYKVSVNSCFCVQLEKPTCQRQQELTTITE